MERHTPVYIRSHKNQAMRSKKLSVDLQDRIVSGEGYQNIYAALKVPKNTMVSIILKRKKFGTTKAFPRAGRPTNLAIGRRALFRELTKNPIVTLTEL